MEKQKNIDILKGLGIIFVVMGHSGGYGSGSLSGYIYSFHMPLFFFISGYLLKIDKKPIDFIKRKITTILIPYTLFFAFSFIWINTVYATIHKAPIFSFPFEKIDFFKALILSGGYLEKIPLNNFPLWFLPHLFIALIISYGILKIRYIVIRTSCIIFLIMVSVPFQQWVHLYGGGETGISHRCSACSNNIHRFGLLF